MNGGVKKRVLVFVGFLLLGLVVYAPALKGPFQFDDKRVILDENVREDKSKWGFGEGLWASRGLVSASFMANYRWWGEETLGYHLINVLVHVVSAYLVFELINLILKLTRSDPVDKQQSQTFVLALLGGALFLVHPLQTQSVAYISQRLVSMMGMFYLLSVVLYLRTRSLITGYEPVSWGYVLAWGVGFLALSSKEVALTLPLMILIMDFVLYKKRDLKQWVILGLFGLLVFKVPVQMIMGANQGRGVNNVEEVGNIAKVVEKDTQKLTRGNYLLTQFNVFRTYMRLLILPVGQSIDYDYALKTEVDLETVLSLSLLLGVVGVGMWRWRKGEKWWMLVAFWFFVPLLVTSSLVPIRDVIYEHRMYLSVMSFVILVVFLLQKKSEYLKYAWGLVAVLAMMSFSRNFVWASELKLWEDAWRKGPGKARTNKNYGYVLTTVGKLDEGIALLEKAVTLKTDDQHYFITLGSAYLQKQEWEKAREAFEKAVELEPGKEDGWNNLGVALFQLKDYAGSKVAFEKSIEVKSDFYMAWLGLGGAEMNLGNIEESRVALERAIELKPRKSEGYNNLLTLYIRIENWPKAWETVGQWEAVEPTNELVRLKKQAILEKLR